ncbi:hypothetical protein JCM10213v2_005651 [Rhodosporidiobolus nylandii]
MNRPQSNVPLGRSLMPPRDPSNLQASQIYEDRTARSSSAGQRISVPSPNGRNSYDRHYPGHGAPPSSSGNGWRGGGTSYGHGHREYGGGGSTSAEGWTNAGSMGSPGPFRLSTAGWSQMSNDWEERGSEGFLSNSRPGGAGSNWQRHKEAALAKRAQGNSRSSTAASSTFYGDAAPDPRQRAREEKQRADREASDPFSVARRDAMTKREMQQKEEAMRKARSTAPTLSALPKPLSAYDKLMSKTAGSSKSRSSSRSSSHQRDKSSDVVTAKKDKGKGRASHLDEDESPPPSKKRSSDASGSGKLKKLRRGGEGFDSEPSRPSTPRPSSSKSDDDEAMSSEVEIASPVISLEARFKQHQAKQDEEEEEEDTAMADRAANSDEEDELLRPQPTIDPATLCPFCDAPLPDKPSSDLVSLQKRLVSLPHAKNVPTWRNKLAVKLPLPETASFCQMHRAERDIIPPGLEKGYPESIDFDALPRRVERECERYLCEIILGQAGSPFLDAAKEEWTEKGKKMRNVMAEWGSFGPRGFEVMLQTLKRLFTETNPVLSVTNAAPLDIDAYVRRVLVPECAISLIKTDQKLSTRDEAQRVLEESRAYGKARFGVVSLEERRENARERERELKAERKQAEREQREAEKAKELEQQDVALETEDDGSPAPAAPPKPAGRKPKAFVKSVAEKGKDEGRGEKRREETKREQEPQEQKKGKRPASSVASSTTSRTSKSSKSTKSSTPLTIPDDSSDIEISSSATARPSKPPKRPKSSSSSKPSTSLSSVAPSLARRMAADKENRHSSPEPSTIDLSSDDDVLDAEIIDTKFKETNKAAAKKKKEDRKKENKANRAKESERRRLEKRLGSKKVIAPSSESDSD